MRKLRGMNQAALADAIGMSQPNISEIETERHKPTLETLIKIAEALDVHPGDLFDYDDRNISASRLRTVAYQLGDEEIEQLLRLALMMAAKNPT